MIPISVFELFFIDQLTHYMLDVLSVFPTFEHSSKVSGKLLAVGYVKHYRRLSEISDRNEGAEGKSEKVEVKREKCRVNKKKELAVSASFASHSSLFTSHFC